MTNEEKPPRPKRSKVQAAVDKVMSLGLGELEQFANKLESDHPEVAELLERFLSKAEP